MEWEQIADKWAAMAHRMRSDRMHRFRRASNPQDAVRIPGRIEVGLSESRVDPGAPIKPSIRNAGSMPGLLSDQ